METLIKAVQNITGFKSLRHMKDGGIWFKCITNDSTEHHQMHIDIFTLIDSGYNVKGISEEHLSGTKVYASFKVKE